MKPETKKELKEWLEVGEITAISLLFFGSLKGSCTSAMQKFASSVQPSEQVVQKTDSVAVRKAAVMANKAHTR